MENALPFEVMTQVKSIVEQYLPGLKEAKYSIAKQYTTWPNIREIIYNKKVFETHMTIIRWLPSAKNIKSLHGLHLHYARLTFDGKGKVVKLAVSR